MFTHNRENTQMWQVHSEEYNTAAERAMCWYVLYTADSWQHRAEQDKMTTSCTGRNHQQYPNQAVFREESDWVGTRVPCSEKVLFIPCEWQLGVQGFYVGYVNVLMW